MSDETHTSPESVDDAAQRRNRLRDRFGLAKGGASGTQDNTDPTGGGSNGGGLLSGIGRASRVFLAVVFGSMAARGVLLTHVDAGSTGVRFNTMTGVHEQDLDPGFHFAMTGVQTVYELPSRYLLLDYRGKQIRTVDNNTVTVDLSIPYRIKPGEAWKIARDGNHLPSGEGEYRFERFARKAADDVILSEIAKLSSSQFYDTDDRNRITGGREEQADGTYLESGALQRLNEELAKYHLEADTILLRQSYFREEYERQLARIQLNEQSKLLDDAKSRVATERQKLDNYENGTQAMVAQKEQDWATRIADLERAYQVGFVNSGEDRTPGAPRRVLEALHEDARADLETRASAVYSVGLSEDVTFQMTQGHLLGIKNIAAETAEYEGRVRAEADGISNRLSAEGAAKVAAVQGAYDRRLNALLNSSGGRAYVAYHAASNIRFDNNLVFQSSDGIPAIYRLREFAERFMGR